MSNYVNQTQKDIRSGSIMVKSGKQTKVIGKKKADELVKQFKNGAYLGTADVLVEYYTEKEGLRIAKSFTRLAKNPAFNLKITFKKIQKNENNN